MRSLGKEPFLTLYELQEYIKFVLTDVPFKTLAHLAALHLSSAELNYSVNSQPMMTAI